MNVRTSRFTRISLHVIGAAGLALLCGQGAHAQSTAAVQRTVQVAKPVAPVERPVVPADKPITQADGSQATGVATDWSSRHMVFSTPGSGGKMNAAATEKVANSVRYIQQLKREALSKRTMKFNSESDRIAAESAGSVTAQTTAAAKVSQAKKGGGGSGGSTAGSPKAPTRDWNISLGNGTVAQNMWPAEYTAGETTISGTGGSVLAAPTGNCLTDFVTYALFAFGSSTQANLVGIDDLYSGTSPAGTCGSAPNIKFAYNASTIGGYLSNSPVLSGDGTMIAFVETNGSQSVFHVLKWAPETATGQSSVTAPVTPTPTVSMAACAAAPCEVSVAYSTSGNTRSSPFYDFQTDAAYVGDDNGNMYEITGVFYGVPTVSVTSPFTATGLAVAGSGVKLTSPIYDFATGNIFVGGSDGYLYAVNSNTGAVSKIQVGAGGLSGQVADAPTVDGFNARVMAYTAADPSDNFAQVVQADTTTPLGAPVSAPVGFGGLGVLTLAGTFDNVYFNYDGSGGNTGHYYIIGTAAASSSPTLYQIPFSGVNSVTLSGTASSGTTNPTATFSAAPSGGITATATASGSIFGVTVSNAGTGYTSFPTATISGTGSGAMASVTDVKILTAAIPTGGGGSNYAQVPTVTINGGTGETATAALGIDAVAVTAPGSYQTSMPTVSFAQAGATAGTGSTSVTILSPLTISSGGNFTAFPTLNFTGTHTGTPAGTVALGLNGITASGGTGYTTVPTINFTGGGGSGAAATANLGLVTTAGAATITNGGSYTGSIPGVTFPGSAGTNGTGTALVGLLSITGGGGSFSSTPTITIGPSGGGGTATPIMAVTGLTPGGTNSGYLAPPAINFSAGNPTMAVGTALMGVAAVSVSTMGSGYTSVPGVDLTGGSPTTAGTGTAYLGAVSYNVANSSGSISIANQTSGSITVPTITVPAPTLAGNPTTTATATGSYAISNCTTAATCNGTTAGVQVGSQNGANCTAHSTNQTVTVGGGVAGTADTLTYTSTSGAVTITSYTSNGRTYTAAAPPTIANAASCSTVPNYNIDYKVAGATAGTLGSGYSGATIAVTFSPTPTGTITVNPVFGVTSVGVNTAGTGYQSNPTPGFTGGSPTSAAAATSTLKIVGASITNGGSYTTFPTATTTGNATLAATVTITGANVGVAGSYSTFPTATATGATLTVTAKVVGLSVATPGSGYATGPVAASFATGAATATVPLSVVGGTVTGVGSYTSTLPTVSVTGGGGSGATAAGSYKVVNVAITNGATFTTFPGVTTTGGGTGATQAGLGASVGVVGVTVNAAGSGYSSGPLALTFLPGTGGSGSGGTGTADLKVVTLNIAGTGGDYTSTPTATFTDPGGTGSGAAATFTLGVLKVGVSSAGNGYTGTPTVAFAGTPGSGAAATATIAPNAVNLTYGGGGYSTPPTVTISGSTGVTATATINPGNIITAGTPKVSAVVSATALLQATPVSDVFDPGSSTDLLFYGFGNASVADVASVNITGGTISGQTAVAEPPGVGGTSAIVVDPLTTGGVQANSIYFATQGAGSLVTITSISSPFAGGSAVATVTTSTANGFVAGDTITISGTNCSGSCGHGSSDYYNGTFTIKAINSSTVFTFTDTTCTLICLAGSDTGGTVIDSARGGYKAVKLTQSGLN